MKSYKVVPYVLFEETFYAVVCKYKIITYCYKEEEATFYVSECNIIDKYGLLFEIYPTSLNEINYE
jgi:hypothetical protein